MTALTQLEETLLDVNRFHIDRYIGAEKAILALRRRLVTLDPTMPDPHDATAWQKIEETP